MPAGVYDRKPRGASHRATGPESAKLSAEEFIRAWQTSADLAAFCEATGIPRFRASRRASWYREEGIPLKFMPVGHRASRLDRYSLSKLAESLVPPLTTSQEPPQ